MAGTGRGNRNTGSLGSKELDLERTGSDQNVYASFNPEHADKEWKCTCSKTFRATKLLDPPKNEQDSLNYFESRFKAIFQENAEKAYQLPDPKHADDAGTSQYDVTAVSPEFKDKHRKGEAQDNDDAPMPGSNDEKMFVVDDEKEKQAPKLPESYNTDATIGNMYGASPRPPTRNASRPTVPTVPTAPTEPTASTAPVAPSVQLGSRTLRPPPAARSHLPRHQQHRKKRR